MGNITIKLSDAERKTLLNALEGSLSEAEGLDSEGSFTRNVT